MKERRCEARDVREGNSQERAISEDTWDRGGTAPSGNASPHILSWEKSQVGSGNLDPAGGDGSTSEGAEAGVDGVAISIWPVEPYVAKGRPRKEVADSA